MPSKEFMRLLPHHVTQDMTDAIFNVITKVFLCPQFPIGLCDVLRTSSSFVDRAATIVFAEVEMERSRGKRSTRTQTAGELQSQNTSKEKQ
jgi:hypothetical protein